MSVVPDQLLQLKAQVKPRAALPKAPDEVREPRKNEPSSFAHVYARERQNKTDEHRDSGVKVARHRPEHARPEAAEQAPPADAEAQVADSGKPLPSDPDKSQADSNDSDDSDSAAVTAEQAAAASDPTPLDPLALMSMALQLPQVQPGEQSDAEPAVTDTTEEADPQALLTALTPAAMGLPSAAPAAMTPASHDPTLDDLNTLPGVKMALDLGAQAQVAAQQGAKEASKSAEPGALDISSSLEELMPQVMPGGELSVKQGDFAKLVAGALPGIDESKSASPEARAENLTARLSALSQAINQPGAANARPVTVPGQPLAMHQNGWTEAVVDKVMWLSSQNLKSADIQLDPLELGRLEVRVHMTQDQTQVSFASPNAGVRDALESQVHRLRDLFSQQGMNLLDVNVSDQSMNRGWQGQSQGQEGDGSRRGGAAGGVLAGNEEEPVRPLGEVRTSLITGARSLVDYYA